MTEYKYFTLNEHDTFKIDTRDLFKVLSDTIKFSDWIWNVKKRNNLIEDVDYITVQNGTRKDVYVSVDVAMQITLASTNFTNQEIMDELHAIKGDNVRVVYVRERRKEFQFEEMLTTLTDVDWETQYNIDNKYRLDFYSIEHNLIIEYDEAHHRYQTTADNERMQYCLEHIRQDNIKKHGIDLTPSVLRVAEGEELKGIKAILDLLK